MKITVVGINYAPERTGIAPYTSGLCEELVSRGHTVKVLTGYPHYPEWKVHRGYLGWKISERIDGVEVVRYRHPVAKNGSTVSRLAMEFMFALRVLFGSLGKPDLVIGVSPSLLSSAALLLRRRVFRERHAFGVWVQDLYGSAVTELGKRGSVWTLVAYLERLVLKSADGVVVIHERFAKKVSETYGLSPSKITVARNWTHVDRKYSADAVGRYRKEQGWDSSTTVVLHAGNMGAKQGLENVVEAAKIAGECGADIKFVLMGDGNRRKHIWELAVGVGAVEIIEPAPQNLFATALAAADFLLLNEAPGIVEMAVPSKLTSYFCVGRPVIAASDPRSPGAEEVLASGAGLAVMPGDPKGLVDAVLTLAKSNQRIAEFEEAGPLYADRVLSVDASVSTIERWGAGLISRRH